MMNLEELKQNRDIVNEIDWEMTPEEAVRLYLEWGNNWARGNYVIRSKSDVSHYFVVYAWDEAPCVMLIRRNSDEALELAKFNLPDSISNRFMKDIGFNKGVYAVDGEVRNWLKNELKWN
ncbi:MAG: hypothetical protein GXP53_04530 [Deltaproteobacteria bacterium]|nr:hypothetical protein [Deltaproteobacteria bacterium]